MHWSYSEPASGDLQQGDILLPTPALSMALDKVHRWFVDPKYLGFMVISQTCDLVRREGGACKTPYVEIAVVRPLRTYVLALLRQTCTWIGDRYFPSSDRNKANELLGRIINQNEWALGIFYLHPESQIGIAEESIALLRVSIALRADEHYETLSNARKGRLEPQFANKLGWLCGNLYSRVGIRDWTESEDDKRVAKNLVASLLKDTDASSPHFVDCPKAFMEKLKDGSLDLRHATGPEIDAAIALHPAKAFKASAIGAVARVLEAQGVEGTVVAKVKNNLSNDPEFGAAIRQGVG